MLPKTNLTTIAFSMLTMLLMPFIGESSNEFVRLEKVASVDTNSANAPAMLASSTELEETIERTYLWAWPMVYLHNLRQPLRLIRRAGVAGGAPVAPVNQISMLTDRISPSMRSIPCPNRDVIYGFGALDLSSTAVVVQVPNFQGRFWLYQLGDHRTESFAQLGSLHHSKPGFYLIVGPNWNEEVPEGIQQVFRSPTNLAYIIPRIHVKDALQDRSDLQSTISSIVAYPLRCFNGKIKTADWSKKKWFPEIGTNNDGTSKWVQPERFFEDLGELLDDYIPAPNEKSMYQDARQLVELGQSDVNFAAFLRDQSKRIDEEAKLKLFDFRNVGREIANYWTTVDNGAKFGDDFVSRTAVAMSNIFVNRADEAKYFHVDQSSDGALLHGEHQYSITFPANELPPNDGFWSLTLYDEDHSLYENPWDRYSVGSSGSELKFNSDGSLTVQISIAPPDDQTCNWLPCPNSRFSLYLRVYAPSRDVIEGRWAPPAINVE